MPRIVQSSGSQNARSDKPFRQVFCFYGYLKPKGVNPFKNGEDLALRGGLSFGDFLNYNR